MVPSSGGSGPPSTWRVMQDDIRRLNFWMQSRVQTFIDWVFDITQNGALRRRTLILAVTVFGWTTLAMFQHPPQLSRLTSEPGQVLYNLGYAFIAPDVLRHLIFIVFAYWLSLRIAAIYLDDVFELNDISVAQKFILQAALASQYSVISIRDGRVGLESQNSPISRIGGPGIVSIHLENAALLEKINGMPRVIGARHGSPVLDDFERLREVFDLRDQTITLTLSGRTQDGIRITAKDIRVNFSVWRGEPKQDQYSSFSQPYAFSDSAILRLVYRHPPGELTDLVRKLIENQLKEFISKHTLSEILASVNPADLSKFRNGQARASTPGGSPGFGATRPVSTSATAEQAAESATAVPNFVSRDKITELFYHFTAQQADALGIQLNWIGVGTWESPAEIILEQHLEAWELSYLNQIHGNPSALQNLYSEARTKELLRLIRETPLAVFGRAEAASLEPDLTKRELLLAYREKLRNAWDIYLTEAEPVPPELEGALKHLTRLTARYVT